MDRVPIKVLEEFEINLSNIFKDVVKERRPADYIILNSSIRQHVHRPERPVEEKRSRTEFLF